MSKDKRKAESDLLAAIRNAARQEQFLEVVSPEEAQKRFAAHLDLVALPGANPLRSTPRSAARWRMTSPRRSTCRRSTAPASTALPCARRILPRRAKRRR